MSLTSKLRLARGLRAELPTPPNSFELGRPYFCLDTRELFIGAGKNSPMEKVTDPDISGVVATMTAGENINAFQAVALHADGLAYKADASVVADADRAVGVAVTSATTGNNLQVQQIGVVDNSGFLFTPGEWVYLGLVGALVQTPSAGAFELPFGVALSASELELQIGTPIIFA